MAVLLTWAVPLYGGVEARSPHFRVVTELEPGIAQMAAVHLEQARALFSGLGLRPDRPPPEPLRVLLFRDTAEMESETPAPKPRPLSTRAFFQDGADRDFIVIAWDAPGDPLVALAHEQVHQLTAGSAQPLWFREGLAEYLSHWETREGRVHLGAPVDSFVRVLVERAWIPLRSLVASPKRKLIAHPAYYAQSWLAVHWLATSAVGGTLPDPKGLDRRIRAMGVNAVEKQLRKHLEALPEAVPVSSPVTLPRVHLRTLEPWEHVFWLAEVLREGGRAREARSRLAKLEKAFPQRPEPSAALGALEMDARRYELAESALRRAFTMGPVGPRTHYRYSLLLLRSADQSEKTIRRARLAAEHARRAQQGDPHEPRYEFTEAQALIVAERWPQAATILRSLARDPAWRAAAETEFSVLVRRRQQSLAAAPPPPLGARVEPPMLPGLLTTLGPIPEPLPPAPARGGQAWPPPGTVVVYGRVTSIDCRENGKIVTVQTPRWRMRLREPSGRPAALYSAPKKWRTLPCGTKGFWEVNVAYRPIRNSDVHGEVVAVLF